MELVNVKISDILQYENSRAKIGDLSELMRSIKEKGLLSPIIIAPNFTDSKKDKKYIIIAGNRRMSACFKLGMMSIDAFLDVNIIDEKNLMLINLTENIQRKNLSPWEDGRYFFRLKIEYNMSEPEISVRVGVGLSYIKAALFAFRSIKTKYSKDIVYNPSGKNLVGKIPISFAKKLNDLNINYRLTEDNKDEILLACKRGELTESKLKDVVAGIAGGRSLEDVIHGQKAISYVRCDIPVMNLELQEIKDKYKLSGRDIMTKIVRGELVERFSDPFKKGNKINVQYIPPKSKNSKTQSKINKRVILRKGTTNKLNDR